MEKTLLDKKAAARKALGIDSNHKAILSLGRLPAESLQD
jgi:hypothetical protein